MRAADRCSGHIDRSVETLLALSMNDDSDGGNLQDYGLLTSRQQFSTADFEARIPFSGERDIQLSISLVQTG